MDVLKLVADLQGKGVILSPAVCDALERIADPAFSHPELKGVNREAFLRNLSKCAIKASLRPQGNRLLQLHGASDLTQLSAADYIGRVCELLNGEMEEPETHELHKPDKTEPRVHPVDQSIISLYRKHAAEATEIPIPEKKEAPVQQPADVSISVPRRTRKLTGVYLRLPKEEKSGSLFAAVRSKLGPKNEE